MVTTMYISLVCLLLSFYPVPPQSYSRFVSHFCTVICYIYSMGTSSSVLFSWFAQSVRVLKKIADLNHSFPQSHPQEPQFRQKPLIKRPPMDDQDARLLSICLRTWRDSTTQRLQAVAKRGFNWYCLHEDAVLRVYYKWVDSGWSPLRRRTVMLPHRQNKHKVSIWKRFSGSGFVI